MATINGKAKNLRQCCKAIVDHNCGQLHSDQLRLLLSAPAGATFVQYKEVPILVEKLESKKRQRRGGGDEDEYEDEDEDENSGVVDHDGNGSSDRNKNNT